MTTKPIVWAADVGSVSRGNFGWCRAESNSRTLAGGDIAEFADGIAQDLSDNKGVAVGFECPLFVPVADAQHELTRARQGENNRAWCAGAGSGALATGLTEYVWIFERVRRLAKVDIRPTFDWIQFTLGNANLFVWEAMVTHTAKGSSHMDDAKIAAGAFWAYYPDIEAANAVSANNLFSLVGAGLLRAGLSFDIALLSKPCIVISAKSINF